MIARLAVVCVALLAVAWTMVFGASQAYYGKLDDLATKVVRRENVDVQELQSRVSAYNGVELRAFCLPRALYDVSLIRGKQVQIALDSSEPQLADSLRRQATSTIRKALSCAPSDPFLWFALFWLSNFDRGIGPETIAFLGRSYELGPHEGWIMLRRNQYSLIAYHMLPEIIRVSVRAEFVALLDSGLVNETADLLLGPGWSIRSELLIATKGVREKYRRQLALRLRRLGYEFDVPGVTLPEWRPWNVN